MSRPQIRRTRRFRLREREQLRLSKLATEMTTFPCGETTRDISSTARSGLRK